SNDGRVVGDAAGDEGTTDAEVTNNGASDADSNDEPIDRRASVQCVALDECHVAGVCQPETGQCTNPPVADGTACSDDHNVCTIDTCVAGVCHAPGNAGTVCRAKAGTYDVAETCNSTSAACPADAKSTARCRDSTGVCDAAESCDGV